MFHDSPTRPTVVPPAHESSWRAALEPLWHRRRVEVFGTLVRVTVPVIGATAPPSLAASLQALLDAQWRGHALSPETEVHAVVVELHETEEARELVLLISIDRSPRDHSIVGTRMLRGLRSALRAARQSAAPPLQSAA